MRTDEVRLRLLWESLQFHKCEIERVMRHHIGGYTKERKDKVTLIEQLQKEIKDELGKV